MERHLTQQKKGNFRSFRPRCGRHSRTFPSLAAEIRVVSPANERAVTPPRCSARVCRQLSLNGAPVQAFHIFLCGMMVARNTTHTVGYKHPVSACMQVSENGAPVDAFHVFVCGSWA